MKDKKGLDKIFIIVIIVVVILIALLSIYFLMFQKNSNNNFTNNQNPSIPSNQNNPSSTQTNNPQNEINLSSCSNIVDTNKKDLCLMNIAINNYNLPTCNKLSTEDAIAGCYFEFAGQRNEPSVCERDEIKNYVTSDGKNITGPDFCYLTVVARNYFNDNFTQQDITTNCNKIKETKLREGCLNYISLKK